MDGTFQVRVHAAAAAAWWTFLIAAIFFVVQWVAYLVVTATEPAWVMSFWGPGATWEGIRTIWFQSLVVLKLSLWPVLVAALWLTLWAKQLRKRSLGA